MTPESRRKYEQKLSDEVRDSLTAEQRQRTKEMIANLEFPGSEQFDDFTTRHSEMRYEADQIIQQEEARRR